MTLMSWSSSGGARGRCDSRCHNAARPDCLCMCGGRYHGAARQPGGLLEMVQVHGEEVLAAARARAAAEGLELRALSVAELLAAIPGQRSLFVEGSHA